MIHWKTLFDGDIGMRHVRIERGDDSKSTLRVSTLVTGTALENEITAESLGQLKERLIEDGEFTEEQATEVINRIMFH